MREFLAALAKAQFYLLGDEGSEERLRFYACDLGELIPRKVAPGVSSAKGWKEDSGGRKSQRSCLGEHA